MLDDKEIVARDLEELADLEEIRGTQYKPRAYRRAARNLRETDADLATLHAEDRIGEIEGVGDAIEDKIAQRLETGTIDTLERVREDVPVDVRTLGQIRGLGAKKLGKLYDAIGVTTLDEMEAAAEQGDIADVSGFGPKTQQNILDEIQRVREATRQWLTDSVDDAAEAIALELEDLATIQRVDTAGALRRRVPLVEGVTLVAHAREGPTAIEAFCNLSQAAGVESRTDGRATIQLDHGPPVELILVDELGYGAARIAHTGNRDHVQVLRERACDHELVLTDHGLEDEEGRAIEARHEEDVYAELGLPAIPPELREGTGEVQAAANDDLPELVTLDDVRGDLQMHTEHSDGATTVQAMAEKADELGYDYILVTDHGPSLTVTGAPSIPELREQGEEIDHINAEAGLDVTVLRGVEANIRPDGIDVPAEVCDELDLVVAALHDDTDQATDRIVEALEAYPIDVFAHPSNRRLTEREGNTLDMDRIVDVADANDVAIEINAQPARLDLDWQLVRQYRGETPFVISTDAHSPNGMEYMRHGVEQAQKGWLEPEHVLNTQPLDALLEALGRR